MRREWRNVLAFCGWFLVGSAVAAPPERPAEVRAPGVEPVRLTVDLSWRMSATVGATAQHPGATRVTGAESDPAFVLEVSEGRVVEAMAWPPEGPSDLGRRGGSGPGPEGSWRLGTDPQGRVRARIEAPLGARLVVRGGDQVVSVPIAAVLERPHETPAPAPLTVTVERLPWDSLAVDLGRAGGDGIVAPGAEIPVSITFNILWPDAAEVALRATAVLRPVRGGDAPKRYELREVVPANRREPPVRIWNLPAPQSEGTYVLEIHASWEPAGREGSRLGWLIRRRKPAAVTNAAVRRLAVTVLDPRATAADLRTGPAGEARSREVEVDSVDLTRSRGHRPWASGRSPLAEPGRLTWVVPAEALIEPSRRDRLRGWFLRSGAEASQLEPAQPSGLAWSAVGLKVAHPDRPHRLTIKVKGGEPAALGVALIEPGDGRPGRPPRVLLDACASGPPVPLDGPPVAFRWLVWPGSPEVALVLVNRDPNTAVRMGTVTLTELENVPAGPVVHEPDTAATRVLGLYLSGPRALDPYGGDPGGGDLLATAVNLGKYVAYCGATAVAVPEDLADRSWRRALDGQADEDATGPDCLEVLRRVLGRQGCSLWLELAFDGPGALPGLPPPDSAEALRRGLVRLDGRGQADGPAYHPLHPEVRQAMKRRVAAALTRSRTGTPAPKSSAGLLIRMGPGPTLLGTPETGVDDATFERFVRETFSPETARAVPGLGSDDPDRFAARLRYLAGVGRMPWLTWRSRAVAALYAELAEAAEAAVPGAVLAVVTPGLDGGPAGVAARRVDLAGLDPSQAWRSVGLDLRAWPTRPLSPLLLRGVTLSSDALAHDLATSPDLDAIVATRPARGLLLSVDHTGPPAVVPALDPSSANAPLAADPSGLPAAEGAPPRGPAVCLSALPLGDGPAADEPLGHALAALDAQFVFLAAEAVAGHEERIRRVAGVLRALPAWSASPAGSGADPHGLPFGIAVRRMEDHAQTFLAIANDSPYPIRLACLLQAPAAATVDDLGRGLRLAPVPEPGGRNLVLDLPPFGVAAIRVGAPQVRIASLTPYSSEAVRTEREAQFRELSAQLARLNRGLLAGAAEPANPGFEPGAPPRPRPDPVDPMPPLPEPAEHALTAVAGGTNLGAIPDGWHLEGPKSVAGDSGGTAASTAAVAIDRENPHTGQGSLRLTAPVASTSVVCDPFVPSAQSSLTIQAFFRSAPVEATVRVWIEGESGGQPYVRRSELSVSTDWVGLAVRASDLPPGGLDSARLRFEMMTPGVLWIDDLHIASDSAAKSVRLNARRTLLEALQAYREQRYADFARLAASHWIKPLGASASARLVRAADPAPKPAAAAGRGSDAAASALPPDRKLR